MEIVYLSRHFAENTYLVAGKCVRCYQESRDVQIVGVNSIFLRKYKSKSHDDDKKFLDKFDCDKEFFVYLDSCFRGFDNIKEECAKNNNRNKFVPPKSPYHLIEEQLYHDPWKLLVATVFLNKTSLRFSRDHLEWFLNSFKTPDKLLQTDITDLEKYFEPLGLQRTRAVQIYYMTHDYLFKNWKKVEEIFGIGQYGRDAYNMFCLGNFNVEPKDRYLRIYKNWYQKVYLQNDDEFAENFYKATSQKENPDNV